MRSNHILQDLLPLRAGEIVDDSEEDDGVYFHWENRLQQAVRHSN